MLNEENLQKAADILRGGGIVAMPTETVYGLAADAKNPEALEKIFKIKGRPINHPLIVHIAHISELYEWAADIPDQAIVLAHAFWPGPLTFILKKAPHVSDIITGGQNTIGVRIPRHPMALSLLKLFGSGVAAPSANRFGAISPTTAEAVREELGDKIDYILEGGQCKIGLESTIVDLSSDVVRILRPGMISQQHIEEVLHHEISRNIKNIPRVSGSMESHYAPKTPLRILPIKELNRLDEHFPRAILVRKKIQFLSSNLHCVLMPETPEAYAHDLYATLRELDKKHFHELIVEALPNDPAWDAIRDRLQRAAAF